MTELQQQLFALQDETYREFHSKLMPDINKETVIGIRIPVLRRFAGEFAKKPEVREFLQQLPHQYYEENNLHMMLITAEKDYGKCLEEVERFVPYIDNWATWCGPCMRHGPIVDELGEEGFAVGKVDVDQNMELAQQFRVMSIPTLIVFKNGEEAHRLVGLTEKEDLKKLLDE